MNLHSNTLKQADIFHKFDQTQLELVANLCIKHSFEAGDVIFTEGADSDELYIIIRGAVDISVDPTLVSSEPHIQEESIVIATLRRGQSFGEIALVDQGLRSATAKAKTDDTELLTIPSEKLMLLCTTYPNLGYKLMLNLAADLALKIRNTDLRIREELLYSRNRE
jgi:CRP-like cAMP-binding protein